MTCLHEGVSASCPFRLAVLSCAITYVLLPPWFYLSCDRPEAIASGETWYLVAHRVCRGYMRLPRDVTKYVRYSFLDEVTTSRSSCARLRHRLGLFREGSPSLRSIFKLSYPCCWTHVRQASAVLSVCPNRRRRILWGETRSLLHPDLLSGGSVFTVISETVRTRVS